MHRELLDETVDRVAQEMTLPASHCSISAVIRDQLHRPTRVPWRIAVAAGAAVVAITVAIVSMWRLAPVPDLAVSAGTTLAGRPLMAVSPLMSAIPRETIAVSNGVTPSSTLTVTPLVVQPLAIADLTELEPLRIDAIRISEIASGEMRE